MKSYARNTLWPWLLVGLVFLSCLPVAVLSGPPMPPFTPTKAQPTETRLPSPTPCCPTATGLPTPVSTAYPPHPTRRMSPTPTATIPVIYPPWARHYFPLVVKGGLR